METRRVHITGASGAGVTTLGRAVAGALSIPHHDTDDYFWLPTTPPYREKRAREDRLRLMREMFVGRPHWVLSGALDGWGDDLIPSFDLVVFVVVPMALRVERLRGREAGRYGLAAVSPGGDRHAETEEFLAWAARYESGGVSRTLAGHRAWISALPCPAIELDGARPTADLAAGVLATLER